MNLYIVPETCVKAAYKPVKRSLKRLQLDLVFDAMSDGRWMTLEQIAKETKQPIQSVSARLRDLRKKQYGGHTIVRMRSAKPRVFLYRMED